MSAHRSKFVAYYRVSTDRQGQSGLGLEAQRSAVLAYLDGGSWTMTSEFTEVESGKHSDRPQLAAALAACNKHKAKLVIAKLDRLSRNLAFIATLMDSGVEFAGLCGRWLSSHDAAPAEMTPREGDFCRSIELGPRVASTYFFYARARALRPSAKMRFRRTAVSWRGRPEREGLSATLMRRPPLPRTAD